MSDKKRKKRFSKEEKSISSSVSLAEDQKGSAPDVPIAPHFDTQERSPEPNTNVEMSKNALSDSFQTDSRPKGT